jgi:hypothetical protein
MKFDELGTTWRENNIRVMSPQRREDLVSRVFGRVERLRAVIVRRDLVETVAAVGVGGIFALIFYFSGNLVSKLGAAIVVFGACFVVFKLRSARIDRAPSRLDMSVRDYCTIEIERLDRQIRLLRSVLWWYISPSLGGAILMTFGIGGVGVATVAYSFFVLWFAWRIHAMNQRVVTGTLLPLHEELTDLLRELSENV